MNHIQNINHAIGAVLTTI